MNEAYRQSALLLHGLHAQDQQWILTQLTPEQQVQLQSHLAELNEIGIPADHSLIDAALSQANTGSPTSERSGPGQALRDASPETILQLIGRQPAWIVSAVLSIEAWPWREAFFVGLEASKRERVRQAIGVRPAPKLAHALINELERRLPTALIDTAATQTAARNRSGLQRFFSNGKRP